MPSETHTISMRMMMPLRAWCVSRSVIMCLH